MATSLFGFPVSGALALEGSVPRLRNPPSITGCSTFGKVFTQFVSYPAGRFFTICRSFGADFICGTSSPPFSWNISTPYFAFNGGFPLT
jgi:hypothetical protein